MVGEGATPFLGLLLFTLDPHLTVWVQSKAASRTFFKSLVWLDLGLNPGLSEDWRTLYSLSQWPGRTTVVGLFNALLDISSLSSCRATGTDIPDPPLATSPYRSSPLAGLQGYIPYPHRAAECMFELVVLLLPGHMWGSIGVHHLWARLCFSSSVLRVWFV